MISESSDNVDQSAINELLLPHIIKNSSLNTSSVI